MAKASHIALPAACATTPRIEKMPAPTIPPIPIETAAAIPICPDAAADEAREIFCVVMIEPSPRSVSARRCRPDVSADVLFARARDDQKALILRVISTRRAAFSRCHGGSVADRTHARFLL